VDSKSVVNRTNETDTDKTVKREPVDSNTQKEQPKKGKETEKERFYRMCKSHRDVDPEDFPEVLKVMRYWGLERYLDENKSEVLQEIARNFDNWKTEQKKVEKRMVIENFKATVSSPSKKMDITMVNDVKSLCQYMLFA